jgi:Photosynthetic reaction centre cytochrome C subunit
MPRDHLAPRALFAAVVAALALSLAPATGAQSARRPRPLENIKVLKNWSSADVGAEMRLMTEALGVKCDHCHVQGNFASDEKRPKHTARRMLELTMALNAENFATHAPAEGQSKLGRVTCYTCHQGAQLPKQGAGPGDMAW